MKAVTLMYHDVCDVPGTSGFPGGDADLYKVSISQFRQHLGEIANAVDARPDTVEKWHPLEDRLSVFLTFDDGGESAMTAADILDEYGWKGHFFVTTGRIGSSGFLDRQSIVELHARGHVIGSHSDSHPLRMGALPRETIRQEWQKSTQILAEIVSQPITTASIPGGFYSKAVRDEAFAAGIRYLFTSEPTARVTTSPEHNILGRYSITNATSNAVVSELISGKGFARIRQSLIWSIKKPIKKIGGQTFLDLRRKILAHK